MLYNSPAGNITLLVTGNNLWRRGNRRATWPATLFNQHEMQKTRCSMAQWNGICGGYVNDAVVSERTVPPIIVRIKDAWPGQSTKVSCNFCSKQDFFKCSGMSTTSELKPRSIEIPLSWDWGFLSKLAVLAVVLRAFASEVLPLSTCPKIPTFKFNTALAIFISS